MKPLLIYGAGGHAECVIAAAVESGLKPNWVLDDRSDLREISGISVVRASEFTFPNEFSFVVAIGDCRVRKEKFQELLERGGEAISVIHPRAYVSPRAKIGRGTVVFPMAAVDPNATVGENVIVNLGAAIGHDCVVESHAHIAVNVGLSSGTRIGEGAWIGIGSCTIQNVNVGEWSTIGAGSVVTRDIPANKVAFGSPAHRKIHDVKRL